ncbi:hypothetical protein ACFPAF_19015 [Hymenobacter endophyticus]|uniref:DUF2975 domain-containing protein n=1 Tax=Hymenobacter endophyticus TaxID=3076335 RepID=A0ABU3TMB4_9BACT|nr:hypothetical protein [Hymenobacter endophyticus]MDU0372499.1 hypothetical protein [Hymenobacter endophyticus]
MTSRNLFIIIIKVIGLLTLKEILVALAQLVSTSLSYLSGGAEIVLVLLLASVAVGLFAVVPYFCLFRAAWLVDKLRLAEDIDQNMMPLNMHRSTVLSIAIIVVGGLLLMHEVPYLGLLLLRLSQERRADITDPDITPLVLSVAKIIIGLLFINKQRQLVSLIELRRKR